MKIVVPSDANSFNISENSFDAFGSRPDVGSSKSNTFAFLAIAMAMPTFWRIPLE